jgi:hypothetical protein
MKIDIRHNHFVFSTGILRSILAPLFFAFAMILFHNGHAISYSTVGPGFFSGKEETVAPLASVHHDPTRTAMQLLAPQDKIGQLAVSIPPPPGDNMVWDPVKQKWIPMEKGINSPEPGKQTINDKEPGRPTADDEPAK